MTEGARCERCLAGVIRRTEGKLDQCGNTYLPTTVWTCDVCGLASYEPARGTSWRTTDTGPEPEEKVSPFELPTRRAA